MTAMDIRLRLNYDAVTGVFVWLPKESVTGEERRWNFRFAGRVAGKPDTRGHIQISLNHRMYAAHRLAWLYVYGEWPSGDLDHRDRVKTNNAIANLRLATRSQNNANTARRRNNTSGVTGVSWHKGLQKWAAYVGSAHLGYFAVKSDAVKARATAAAERFGDFAGDLVPLEAA